MRLGTTNLHISKKRDGSYFSNVFDKTWRGCKNTEEEYILKTIYRVFSRRSMSDIDKLTFLERACTRWNIDFNSTASTNTNEPAQTTSSSVMSDEQRARLQTGVQSMMNFFSEFSFEPNFRFLNCFSFACNKSKAAAKEYINNYFKLIDSQFVQSINEKMQSIEFTQIVDIFKSHTPSKRINTRLKIYYGSQGTGKTTFAMKESSSCMVCHSAMLPSDLMEDFKFNDGKAEFTPSALQNAIVNGEIITLDEMNLLPFESLRFLQSILDGKTEFMYKGKTIQIADGFKVIGTMNLTVNGCTYALPEPLIDRCEEIKEYKLNAEQLMGAII